MLTVRSSSSDLIVHHQQQAVSPYAISELVPNTLYSLDLTLVFEGGEAGMPVRVNATTLEGGKQGGRWRVEWSGDGGRAWV